MVAMDFCCVNTEVGDDLLAILRAMCAAVQPEKSESEIAAATTIGYLDFWGHQEVVIKCDREKNMKQNAELLQE